MNTEPVIGDINIKDPMYEGIWDKIRKSFKGKKIHPSDIAVVVEAFYEGLNYEDIPLIAVEANTYKLTSDAIKEFNEEDKREDSYFGDRIPLDTEMSYKDQKI